jgi:hypothetical protein
MQVSTGELRGGFATSAFCAWVVDWRRNMIAGDQTGASRDAQVIAGALRWNAIRTLDPHPSTRVRRDMSFQLSQFGWTLPYIRAIAAGDLRQVNRLIASGRWGNNFWYYDPGFSPGYVKRGGDAGTEYMRYLAGARP